MKAVEEYDNPVKKKLFAERGKYLKEREYNLFKQKINKFWRRFEAVRAPFWANWKPEDGSFGALHDKIVAPAHDKYQAAIKPYYEKYELRCLAINSIVKTKQEILYSNYKELDAIINMEAKRLQKVKETEQAQYEKLRIAEDKELHKKIEANLSTFKQVKTIKQRLLKK